jgi:acyl-coenzyme A synthetase/AMP-(fatty) acid ligase
MPRLREEALTKAIDAMSVADILAALPHRINEVIVRHIADRPTHSAFAEGGRTWSYREFAKAVNAVVADFVRLQIRPGDRVLLAIPWRLPRSYSLAARSMRGRSS